ncbi:hypothetical protein GJ496_003838 [Pomphorhynchus laevis]|nr:hypothetical protein GJ496_003838 [Pomphorhynchus laevis]
MIRTMSIWVDGVDEREVSPGKGMLEEQQDEESTYIASAIANYDFSAEGFGDDIISIKAGDILNVIELDTGDGWTRIAHANGSIGFVPTSYCVMRYNR